MRTKLLIISIAMLVLVASPLAARHKHRRGCGHVYDQRARSWVTVEVFSPRGGFYIGGFTAGRDRGPYGGRRYARGYYDRGHDRGYDRHYHRHHHHRRDRCRDCGPYYDYERRYGKRHYHRGHRHDHFGKFCPRY